MDRIVSMARFDESDTEPNVVAECAHCHGDISVGDFVHRIDDAGGFAHDGICAEEYAMEHVYDVIGTIDINGNIN
jgi:hypothetical protein